MIQTKNNWIRQLYTMDNLPVLRSIDSETANLIYLTCLPTPENNGKILLAKAINAYSPLSMALGNLSDTHADKEMLSATNYSRVNNIINIRVEL